MSGKFCMNDRLFVVILSKDRGWENWLQKVCCLTHISLASFLWDIAKSAKPDQTRQNVASDQDLHCLLTEVPFKILNNNKKNTTQHPYNWKWTRLIDKDGKIHSA